MRVLLFVVPLCALFATGCESKPRFVDDEGMTHVLEPSSDELSLPYARGTRVGIEVSSGHPKATWTITSDAPAIFAIEERTFDNGILHVVGHAAAEGSTEIRLRDGGGEELHHATVTIKAANQARVYGHGALRLGGRDEAALQGAQLTNAAIVTGGKGAFALVYYRDQERLYGRGLLDAANVANLTVTHETTKSVTTNEWLFVVPTADGAYELPLRQDGTLLATLPITAVPATALTSIALAEELGVHRDEDLVWLVLKASDAAGHDVLGVYADWTLDGVAQGDGPTIKPGDLYRYSRKQGKTRNLIASVGALTASKSIDAEQGWVYDTTFLGCSAGATPGASLVSLLFVGAALLLARRARIA